MIGYCVKCKHSREMKSEQKSTMSNGRKMMKGKCSKCGTTICRIGG